MTIKFLREREKRDAPEQVVKSVVKKVDCFNRNGVPNFLKAYNVEMTMRDVYEATKLKYFCQVVAISIHKEVRELQEAHKSWASFEEALLEAYGYEKPKG